MKTEKRLTMALSVLVALMMLAVPAANFVSSDSGDSSSDAPNLGAAGDTLTINLNIPESSLDTLKLEDIVANGTEQNKANLTTTNVIYSVDAENKVIRAICSGTEDVSIKAVLDAVESVLKNTSVDNGRMTAYDLSWTGIRDTSANISGQITADAKWDLKDTHGEVTITTEGLDENLEMVKAYAYADNKTKLTIDALPAALSTAGNGYVVNLKDALEKEVYKYTVKDSEGNTISDGKTISAGSSLVATYEFDIMNYGKLTVTSPIFDEAIVFYTAKTTDAVKVADTTYAMVFDALIAAEIQTGVKYLDDVKDADNSNVSSASNIDADKLPLTANDGSVTISSWSNGSEPFALNSNSRIVGSEIVLNAEFKTFKVTFMVNGQVQTVNVKYGEFSEDSCPFDVGDDLVCWKQYGGNVDNMPTFDFGMGHDELQETLIVKEGVLTLIALFSDPTNTVYVTFDATTNGYFGDESVTKVIVPVAKGTTADKIPMPVNPVQDDANGMKYQFAYYSSNNSKYEFKSTVEVNENSELTAEYIGYKFTVTLYVDNNVYAIIYCSDGLDGTNLATVNTGVWFDGNYYTAADLEGKTLDYLKNKLFPEKKGYDFVSWNDEDGEVAFEYDMNGDELTWNLGKVSADTSIYAEFKASEYRIIYSGNTAASTNNMLQIGTVDEDLRLLGESTFSNDGYKLKEWNTRPDGLGTSYALESIFNLSGDEYDELQPIVFINGNVGMLEGNDVGLVLYAIWEKVDISGGDVPVTPGSSDGNSGNDNLALYLIAIVILIVGIGVIVILLRKK